MYIHTIYACMYILWGKHYIFIMHIISDHWYTHISFENSQAQVPAPLAIQLPVDVDSNRQQLMAQIPGSLLSMWKIIGILTSAWCNCRHSGSKTSCWKIHLSLLSGMKWVFLKILSKLIEHVCYENSIHRFQERFYIKKLFFLNSIFHKLLKNIPEKEHVGKSPNLVFKGTKGLWGGVTRAEVSG